MHTAHPMMSVTGGLEGLALEVLAGSTRPLSLTEVHRLAADASMSGIRKALRRLVSSGLVDDVPGGYLLNREHLAADAILDLSRMRRALFERIRSHVARWSPQPALVGMYGSVARRDGDEHSDIDILLIGEQIRDGSIGELAEHVRRWTGNDCQIVTLTPTEFNGLARRKEPVVESWRRDVIVLLGDRAILDRGGV